MWRCFIQALELAVSPRSKSGARGEHRHGHTVGKIRDALQSRDAPTWYLHQSVVDENGPGSVEISSEDVRPLSQL